MERPTGKALNLGKKSSAWLAQIGVYSLDDVEEIGVVETYLLVKEAFPEKVTLNMLWGLQGALLGIPWNQLPEEMKNDLLQRVKIISDAGSMGDPCSSDPADSGIHQT